MQPKNRYRMTPGVKHSGISYSKLTNLFILLIVFINKYCMYLYCMYLFCMYVYILYVCIYTECIYTVCIYKYVLYVCE